MIQAHLTGEPAPPLSSGSPAFLVPHPIRRQLLRVFPPTYSAMDRAVPKRRRTT
jgi:hypothetical protein